MPESRNNKFNILYPCALQNISCALQLTEKFVYPEKFSVDLYERTLQNFTAVGTWRLRRYGLTCRNNTSENIYEQQLKLVSLNGLRLMLKFDIA